MSVLPYTFSTETARATLNVVLIKPDQCDKLS